VLSGWAATHYGWRGVLWVPAILLVVSAIHMWIFLEDRPGEVTSKTPPDSQAGGALSQSTVPGPGSIRSNLIATLANPSLWLVAVTLCLLDACRYGFTDWGVTHLKEVHHDSVDSAAFKYAVVPLGGILGALFAGWVSDRFLNGRRAPVMFVMLLVLGALGFGYDQVLHWGLLASVLILFAIGFCIFGSQVLLVGTFPVDLARRGTAAAAVGLVNFMGYMGAAAGDVVSPHLVKYYGWPFAVRFWAACALAGAVIIAFLWNAGARPRLVYSSEGK
jgi:sugar phosphate permease